MKVRPRRPASATPQLWIARAWSAERRLKLANRVIAQIKSADMVCYLIALTEADELDTNNGSPRPTTCSKSVSKLVGHRPSAKQYKRSINIKAAQEAMAKFTVERVGVANEAVGARRLT